jgi:GT2 family glycosyltransferase
MNLTSTTDRTYDVAVILINYNSSDFTADCVNSVIKNTDRRLSYGISIIDNSSATDDYKNLVEKLSQIDSDIPVHLFRSKINTGFSGGNMLGVQFITASYYFFLNNDCQLQNDCLNILHDFCEANPNTALCSPQLYDENGEHHPCINYFPYLITKIFGLGILKLTYKQRFFKRKALYHEPLRVDVVSGSQLFVRASVFNRIGGFDTTYFLYCEEEDIAFKVAAQGFDTYLIPEAKNTHFGGGSTTASLDIKKEFYISFLYFYRTHFGVLKTQALKFILIQRLLRKAFREPYNLQLITFILSGAHSKHSLKHRQPIIDNSEN